MDRRAVYGPRDGTVLSQQLQHRSDDIPEGEATITLEDVQIIWALPIDGLPVTGGLMCPDSSGNMVPLLYLSKLEEINAARNYSGAVLSLHFYTGNYVMPVSKAKRQLVVHCNCYRFGLGRVLFHFPVLVWNAQLYRTVRTTVRVIRDILDNMQEDQFIWQPYDMDSDRIMAYAADFTPELWRSACPLIFYAIVEIHHPERVFRQFGMRQNIPEMPDSQDMTLHQISCKARTGTDWGVQHILHIRRWQRRRDTIVNRPPIFNERHTERGYWDWYNNITRRFVS
ncbi:UNVERIFIED_CONTAM: Serine/threonine-protein phosphatase 7 long form [Sesamum radiatum]|uniref:Serine/threonine-protein phosphatase 7 long form n=1 Tax=Sesamum radiatum TaxID=300843 RepID=A0AAW2UBQ5_SESRA